MYLPPHFNARHPAIALDPMRAHPFAGLASNDCDSLPFDGRRCAPGMPAGAVVAEGA